LFSCAARWSAIGHGVRKACGANVQRFIDAKDSLALQAVLVENVPVNHPLGYAFFRRMKSVQEVSLSVPNADGLARFNFQNLRNLLRRKCYRPLLAPQDVGFASMTLTSAGGWFTTPNVPPIAVLYCPSIGATIVVTNRLPPGQSGHGWEPNRLARIAATAPSCSKRAEVFFDLATEVVD